MNNERSSERNTSHEAQVNRPKIGTPCLTNEEHNIPPMMSHTMPTTPTMSHDAHHVSPVRHTGVREAQIGPHQRDQGILVAGAGRRGQLYAVEPLSVADRPHGVRVWGVVRRALINERRRKPHEFESRHGRYFFRYVSIMDIIQRL